MKSERHVQRPDPEAWMPHELMSLPEAAAVFFPCGPLTVTSLRTAVHRGELAVTRISGKLFTTPAAVAAMATCAPSPAQPPKPRKLPPPGPGEGKGAAGTTTAEDLIRHLLRPISVSVGMDGNERPDAAVRSVARRGPPGRP